MLKNIIKSYSQLFNSIIKVILLLAVCCICGSCIVLPLWKFATKLPQAYTYTVLSLIFILLIFLMIKAVKKHGLKSSLLFAAKLFVIAAGIYLSVLFVITGMRILALPVLLLTVFLYGFISYLVKKQQKKELQNETAD